MTNCQEHLAQQGKLEGMDKRLCATQEDVSELTKVSIRQVALMEQQGITNRHLEEGQAEMRKQFEASQKEMRNQFEKTQKEMRDQYDDRLTAIESKPSRYFDLGIGAIITGVIAYVLFGLGLGA